MYKVFVLSSVPMFTMPIQSSSRYHQFLWRQLDKAIKLGLRQWQAYVDLGAMQAKVLLQAVGNPQQLHECTDNQLAMLSLLGCRVLNNYRALDEWSNAAMQDTLDVLRKNWISVLFKDGT